MRGVVASAGTGRKAQLIETSPDHFARLWRTNVAAPLLLVQAARTDLAKAGGTVVLVSSDASVIGEAHIGAYSVTKAALNMVGKMLAIDLAPEGVRVNIICSGDIVPGMREMLRPGEAARPADDHLTWPTPPLGRWGDARDVGAVAAFQLSPDAAFMTGSVVLVDGGSRAGHRRRRASVSPAQTQVTSAMAHVRLTTPPVAAQFAAAFGPPARIASSA